MRPIPRPNAAYYGDPGIRLNDERDSFAYDPSFKWGWQRWIEIADQLAYAAHDGREPWPTETHRRIHRAIRMWLMNHRPHDLIQLLVDSQPDANPYRQLVEDVYLAVSKDMGLENWNHSLMGSGR